MSSKMVSILLCVIMVTGYFQGIVHNVGLPNPGQPFQGGSNPTGGLADSPWPMFRQNLNHTGLSPYDMGGNNGQLKWSFTTGHYISSSPAISSDGTIYIGSDDHKFYAINLDGTEKWNFSTCGDVRSSPAISSDGTIYVGSSDTKLYALNLDGTEKWSFSTSGEVRSSPAISSDGTIYVGSGDDALHAINPDGTEKWNYLVPLSIHSSPAISPDGTIYVGSYYYNLYAINPDGSLKWSFTTGGSVWSSPAIDSNGIIYIGSCDKKLYAIYPDGTEKWNYPTDDMILSSPAIGSNGIIYVGSDDNKLYAINPDGTEKWNFSTNNIIRSSPAISSDGTIYVGSWDKKLYAINSNGTKKWEFETGHFVRSSPAIDIDGTIYVGSDDNILYAIGTTDIPPIANIGPDLIVNEGDIVQFDASTSYDPDGTIQSYEWDFDNDGTYDFIETLNNAPDGVFDGKTTHIYGDDGVFTVTLRVTDTQGANDTDNCQITVQNLAPSIDSISVPSGSEGSLITFTASSIDNGSDDLMYNWEWGDGTNQTTNIYYNNGATPEPVYNLLTNIIKSPEGTYPFEASDTVEHIYGDNGIYDITLTITDDDGGETVYFGTVTISNVAPAITLVITPSGEEGSEHTFSAEANDPGSDDLTFNWSFEYGPTIENIHYNNGVSPEPVYDPATNDIKSPGGIFPFNASDTVTHTYGDNYNYTLNLTVTDDDGGVSIYETIISIDNIAPSITMFMIPYPAYEGTSATYGAVARDLGSDDLSFEWNFGDSTPIIESTYYNDGNDLDPYPSPAGTYPFTASDILNHTYGDDYNYTLSLKVTDDDDGITVFTTTVYVNNVAPTIEPFGPLTIDEGSPLNVSAIAEDIGSDDLTFEWKFECGPMITNTYYNDGTNPDPYPSPWGTYPFNSSDIVTPTYGDNYNYTLTLTITDDDGGSTTFSTLLIVNNVAPTIKNIEAYTYANFTLRIAGEKWHDVRMYLYEGEEEIGYAGIVRYPGNPDEQTVTISDIKFDLTKNYSATVFYTPEDDPVNGQPNGATPCWIILTFEEGSEERIHHTFNVRHSETWERNVNLNKALIGHNITFKVNATDPGSDDLTFSWDWDDGTPHTETTYYNNGIAPDPLPSPLGIFPFSTSDKKKHAFIIEQTYSVTFILSDDDGGINTTLLIVMLD